MNSHFYSSPVSLQLHSQQHKNPQSTNYPREKLPTPVFFGRSTRFNGETKKKKQKYDASALVTRR